MEKEKVELYPPYVMIYNKIKALFGEDPELIIGKLSDPDSDEDIPASFTICSENRHKLNALKTALNTDLFATLNLNINFEYSGPDSGNADFVIDLFKGNPHFSRAYVTRDASAPDYPVTICYFKDETIQYPADSRFVPHGYETTLAEELVKELFNHDVRRMKYITEEKKTDFVF